MTPDQILQRAVYTVPSYAIFVFDDDGTALTWNEGVQQVLGYSRDEFISSDADRIFTIEDREQGAPNNEREQARRKGAWGDFRWHVRKDGSLLWSSGVVYSVRDDDGQVAGFVKIMRDATREKKLQDALERSQAELEERVAQRNRELMDVNDELVRSEANLREVFRLAPIAILLTTPEDEILNANEAFELVTGYTRNEVTGQNAKRVGFWNSPEDQQKLREAQAAGLGFSMLELQIRKKNGDVREVLASAAVVLLSGNKGLVKMFLDITERKQTERELMLALQEVMQDTSWLAQRVVEKLSRARGEQQDGPEVSDLTPRERDVLARMAEGKNNEQIMQELGLAASTVRNYVTNLYAKLGVSSRAEAVVWARNRGLGG